MSGSTSKPSVLLRTAVLCWAASLGVALITMAWHDALPGDQRLRARQTALAYTVTLYAHPQCPCTRSSIEELAKIVTKAPAGVAFEVWFYRPGEESDSWARSPIWNLAAEIPGVHPTVDPEGRGALAAGAETSGHVVVRDASGRVVYSGGITGSRAHSGDNPGADAVLSWLHHGRGPSTQPVYGCQIQDEVEP